MSTVKTPARLTKRTAASLTALALAASLSLAACGGNDEPSATTSGTPSPTQPSPTSTVEVPADVAITEPGTQLTFGDTATVAYQFKDQGTVLDLTVDSAKQGSLDDFAGFSLDDPYTKRGNYYYVRVTVKNAGEAELSDVAVPLWGISDKDTLLQPVEFKSSFDKCPTEALPSGFAPGDEFKTCLVYLSPDHGALDGVSYRPTTDYTPIEWHGDVKMLPTKKDSKKKGGKKG